MTSSAEFAITKLNSNDFDEWAALFRGYIDFYETTIPEDQYRKTFDRILDPNSDLYALVMRQKQQESENGKMIAIAHFFPSTDSMEREENHASQWYALIDCRALING